MLSKHIYNQQLSQATTNLHVQIQTRALILFIQIWLRNKFNTGTIEEISFIQNNYHPRTRIINRIIKILNLISNIQHLKQIHEIIPLKKTRTPQKKPHAFTKKWATLKRFVDHGLEKKQKHAHLNKPSKCRGSLRISYFELKKKQYQIFRKKDHKTLYMQTIEQQPYRGFLTPYTQQHQDNHPLLSAIKIIAYNNYQTRLQTTAQHRTIATRNKLKNLPTNLTWTQPKFGLQNIFATVKMGYRNNHPSKHARFIEIYNIKCSNHNHNDCAMPYTKSKKTASSVKSKLLETLFKTNSWSIPLPTYYINNNPLINYRFQEDRPELWHIFLNEPSSAHLRMHNFTLNHTKTPAANTTINNYYPLFYFSTTPDNVNPQYTNDVTRAYFNKIGRLHHLQYKDFFNYFVLNFLETYLHKKIWVRVDARNHLLAPWKGVVSTFCNDYTHLFKRFNRLISARELLEIIILMLITRDLQIFLMFLKRRIETAHFKKHKKILSILFDILRKNQHLLAEFGIRGFFFDIRGKVGVSGNAKKRHLNFTLGKITTTSQNVKTYLEQINIWTPTGQMGITCYLIY